MTERLCGSKEMLRFVVIVLLIVISLFLVIGVPFLIEQQITSQQHENLLISSPYAPGFARWQKSHKNVRFYFFNVTNAADFPNAQDTAHKGWRPALKQLGPFVYRRHTRRYNYTWQNGTADGDTLTYNEHNYYVFDPDKTRAETHGKFDRDDIPITNVNSLFLGAQAKLGTGLWESLYQKILPLLAAGYPVSDYDKMFACKFQGTCSTSTSIKCNENSNCPATETCGNNVNAANCEKTDPKTGKKVKKDTCVCTTRPTVRDWLTGYMGIVGRPDSPIAFNFPGLQPNVSIAADLDMQNTTTIRVGTTDTAKVAQVLKWRGMPSLELTCPWARSPDLSGIEAILQKLHVPLFPYEEWCPNAAHTDDSCAPCCGKTKLEGGKKVPNVVPYWDSSGSYADEDPSHPEGHPPNKVLGSEGTQFAPGLTDFSYLSLWVPPLYRHIVLGVNKTLNREVAGTGDADVIVKGIKLKRFTTPEWGVVNSSKYPPNANYYMNGPAGMQNMSVAQQGAPVFISKPHFLDCGLGAKREVTGLAPDRARHDTFLDVEPSTGITMQEHKRIQINVEVQRIPLLTLKSAAPGEGATWFQGLGARKIYVPVMWLEEQSVISDAQATEFKQVYTVRLVGACAALGGAVLLVATIAAAFRAWNWRATPVPEGLFDEPLLGAKRPRRYDDAGKNDTNDHDVEGSSETDDGRAEDVEEKEEYPHGGGGGGGGGGGRLVVRRPQYGGGGGGGGVGGGGGGGGGGDASVAAARAVFDALDRDGNGEVDAREFILALRKDRSQRLSAFTGVPARVR